jgi:hypothetical membrane protein
MTRNPMTDASARRIAGAIVFVVTGLQYVTLEAIAAAAWTSPPYDYAYNYISDLGVPDRQLYDGRVVDSPLAWLMNTAFVLDGVLFVLAALLLGGLFAGVWRWLFLSFAVLHGVGSVLVGLFNEAADAGSLHLLGAFLSIVFGNLAVFVVGLTWRRLGIPGWLGVASLLLPVAGLLSEAVLFVSTDPRLDGIWERGGVYSITVWELLFGVVLLVGWRARPAAPIPAAVGGVLSKADKELR